MLKTWPSDLYESQAVINAIKSALDQQDNTSTTTPVLMECLVEIYTTNHQPGRALPYYLRLRKPGVFDLIRQNNLFADVNDQVTLLVDFQQDMKLRDRRFTVQGPAKINKGDPLSDTKHGEAIDLLVDHTQSIPVSLLSRSSLDINSADSSTNADLTSGPAVEKQQILSLHVPRRTRSQGPLLGLRVQR